MLVWECHGGLLKVVQLRQLVTTLCKVTVNIRLHSVWAQIQTTIPNLLEMFEVPICASLMVTNSKSHTYVTVKWPSLQHVQKLLQSNGQSSLAAWTVERRCCTSAILATHMCVLPGIPHTGDSKMAAHKHMQVTAR